MNEQRRILPYLDSLQGTLATLAPSVCGQPDAALQVSVARGLLDHLVVQHGVAPALQLESYAAVSELLPALGELLPGEDVRASLAEAGAICASRDVRSFDRLRRLTGPIQRALMALGTPRAVSLARAVLAIETDYCGKFSSALAEQNARTAKSTRTLTAARNTRQIDHAALAAFIRDAYPDEKELTVTDSAVIAGGYSKFTAGITLANTRHLPSQMMMRGDAAATFGGISVTEEFRHISVAHRHGVRVPRPFAVDASGALLGTPFMLVERMPGAPTGNMYAIPKGKNTVLNADIAARLASIHRVPLSELDTRISGANRRSSEKALEWVDEAVAAFAPLDMPSTAWETAFEWLRRNAALYDEGPRGLVHGDYGINNLLVHDNAVTAILDWEFVHVGNTAYDLGYFHPAAIEFGTWEQFLDAYANAGGPLPGRKQLDYSVLLGATRIGVMLCQTQEQLISGKDTGMAPAMTIGADYYGLAQKRVAAALDNVL